MDRFVVFICDDRSPAAAARVDAWTKILTATTSSWIEACSSASLRAFVLRSRHGQTRYSVGADATGSGLVIGTLFERGYSRRGAVKNLAPEVIRALAGPEPSDAGAKYWGDFTAIWRGHQDRTANIFRDPCGSTSCFRLRAHKIDILFSHLPDVIALPDIELSIDWTSVQAFLVHNYFITRHTGFHEIREILPGEQVACPAEEQPASRWPWNSVEIAARAQRLSFSEAIETLRQVTRDCFQGWGAVGGDVAVRLSGGLDSSIVLALARQYSSGAVTALHVRGRGYETQDLIHAHIAAEHAGVELLELDPPETLFDVSSFARNPLLPRPCSQLLGAAVDTAIANACDSLNAQSTMTGNGGDSLFLQRGMIESALADYVQLNGLGRDLGRIAYECAVLQQTSVWSVFGRLRTYLPGHRRPPPYQWLGESSRRPRGSATPAFEDIPSDYVMHPCMSDAGRLPPCKASQVTSIISLRNYYSRLSLGLNFEAIEPFVSQPIVEFCLQTPTYLFSHGAMDRALERHAFAELLPPQIARRFQKGFINHQVLHDMQNHIGTLREFLAEGQLVSHGLTAKAAVIALFEDDQLFQGTNLPTMLNLLAAEAWLATVPNQ